MIEFPFVDAVLKESLRLYPTLAVFNREVRNGVVACGFSCDGFTAKTCPMCVQMKANEDCEIAPAKFIPRGTLVHINAFSLHRDPLLWRNPNAFRPDHFLDPDEVAGRDPHAFLPFGLGPRMCIGMRFAVEEMQIALIGYVRARVG